MSDSTDIISYEEISQIVKPPKKKIDVSRIFTEESFSSARDWKHYCKGIDIVKLTPGNLSPSTKKQLSAPCRLSNNGSIVADTHFLCHLPGSIGGEKISLGSWTERYSKNLYHDPKLLIKRYPHIYDEGVRQGWWLIYQQSIFASGQITSVWEKNELPRSTDKGDVFLIPSAPDYVRPNLMEFIIFHYIFWKKRAFSRIKNIGAGRVSSKGLAVAVYDENNLSYLAVNDHDDGVKYSGVGHIAMTRLHI